MLIFSKIVSLSLTFSEMVITFYDRIRNSSDNSVSPILLLDEFSKKELIKRQHFKHGSTVNIRVCCIFAAASYREVEVVAHTRE